MCLEMFLRYFAFVFFLALGWASVVKIDVLEKPEKCEFKSQKGDTLTWQYRGTQLDGEEFSNGTFTAVLGKNSMVQGIDDGMYDMCVKEKRRIEIPPELGYKTQGKLNIYFYNELLELVRGGKTLASTMPSLTIEVVQKKDKCDHRSKRGDTIHYHYKGVYEDGKPFGEGDFKTELGTGTVIKGVEDGMYNMCVGEERKLIIPPHLAFGDKGNKHIPGGKTLIYFNKMTKIDVGLEKPLGATGPTKRKEL